MMPQNKVSTLNVAATRMGVDYQREAYLVPTVQMVVCGRAGLSLLAFSEHPMIVVDRRVPAFRRALRLSHVRQMGALEVILVTL